MTTQAEPLSKNGGPPGICLASGAAAMTVGGTTDGIATKPIAGCTCRSSAKGRFDAKKTGLWAARLDSGRFFGGSANWRCGESLYGKWEN